MRNRALLLVAGGLSFVAVILISMLLVSSNNWSMAKYGSMGLLAIAAALFFIMPVIVGGKAGDAGRIASIGTTVVFQGVIAIWALLVLLCAIFFLPEKWIWAGNVITVVAFILAAMSNKSVASHADRVEQANSDNRFEWISMCMLLDSKAKDTQIKSSLKLLAESIRYSASSMDSVAKDEEKEIEKIIYNALPVGIESASAVATAVPLIDRVKELLLIRDQKLKIARSKF